MKKLLIVSDLHGNWPALEAVLAAEPDFDEIACCGDIVDYGPEPEKCLHWVRDNVEHAVRGNHDNALGFDRDCKCMGSFREMSVATRAWHRTLMSDADLEFLRSLPTLDWFPFDNHHFRLAHATPQGDMFEYLSPSQWPTHILGMDADFILLGHTHVQGIRSIGKVVVVNPGSVGLARDHAGKACYAIYQAGNVVLRRIPYDVSRTIAELRRAPLPAAVVEGLVLVLSPKEA
ncbi:MAG TPA: metallophosphoesterase family protein [Pirellulales bacterium]|jgi:putative phosphoesterase|nr:metallophosphoesterase family protein [Pirellulales bacterium]